MSHKFLALAQTPKGVIYGNSKNNNSWTFMAKNIYGTLVIYD